jgi:hypothetical protein
MIVEPVTLETPLRDQPAGNTLPFATIERGSFEPR